MTDNLKLKSQINLQFSVVKGPHAGQRFSFNKTKVTIGRSPECDIILVNDPMVSRVHAAIDVINNEVEIKNLSPKNTLIVNGELVQKWKLVNQTHFTVGDSEIQIITDLGQSVVAVKPQVLNRSSVNVSQQSNPKSVAPKMMPQTRAGQPAQMASYYPQSNGQHGQRPQQNFNLSQQTAPKIKNSLLQHPKFKIYALMSVIVFFGLYIFLDDSGAASSKKKKALLKYNDEVEVLLKKEEIEKTEQKRQIAKEKKQSIEVLKFQENFSKGMRDFQLGNFNNAQNYFQLALNYNPNHALTKNYLYLSKVRFDELVKSKMLIADNYYQSQNYRMCASMYRQVIDMLQGRPKDINLDLAVSMKKKCEDAAEGIF